MRKKTLLMEHLITVGKVVFNIWILAVIYMAAWIPGAIAYEIVQLTENECIDTDISINDHGQVAWVRQCGEENTAEIMFFDGSSIIQLTDDDYKDFLPIINNQGRVIWHTDWDITHSAKGIFYYDGMTTIQASSGSPYNSVGDINDSGALAWISEDTIYLYDGADRVTFGNVHGVFIYPEITINNSGQLAWRQQVWDDGWEIDIFLHNGSEIVQLTDDGGNDYPPRLNSAGNVAWISNNPWHWDILIYDGSTTNNIMQTQYYLKDLELSDSGQAVWTQNSDSFQNGNFNFEVFLYNGSNTVQLTKNAYEDRYTQINGTGVVIWVSSQIESKKVMLNNGIATILLADNAHDDTRPKIGNDGAVAWEGFDGQDLEIFLAVPSILHMWSQTYGGIDGDYASEVLQTADRGYILTGYTSSFGAGGINLWAMKLDESGTVQWERSYGGLANDTGPNIRKTSSDGGYIMAATTGSFGAGLKDVWLLKLDTSGDVLWEKTIGGNAADVVSSIEELPSGGYILAGRTESFGAGTAGDLWVVRLNTMGSILWQKTYGTADGGEYATSLQPTEDGGCVVAGTTFSSGAGDEDFWILRLDADGGIVWQKTYGGSDIDTAKSIQITGDEGFIVAGNTYSFPVSVEGYDILVLKLNPNGEILWQKTFGTVGWDDVSSVESSWDGGYFLTGSTGLPEPLAPRDGWVMKLSSTGEILWQKKFGGTDPSTIDTFSSLYPTYDGGIVIAGSTDSFGAGLRDALMLKLDSDGVIPDCSVMADWSAAIDDPSVIVSTSSGLANDTTATEASTSAIVSGTTFLKGNGCSGVADFIDLPSTGQTDTYITGDDGYFSNYGVSWPIPRFADNGDGTITDTLTGLMWFKDGNVASTTGHDPNDTGDGRMHWESALDFVTGINDETYDILSGTTYTATYTDWRVPNINELESLANWGESAQAAWLNGEGFDNVQPEIYWSSSTNPMYTYFAWHMRLSSGHINYGHKESSSVTAESHHIFLVRAGQQNYPDSNYPGNVWKTGQIETFYPGDDGELQMGIVWPSPRFIENGDGTVSDSLTGLIWLQDGGCLGFQNTWESAHDTVADFNDNPSSYNCEMYTAAYTDWRVPNRKEAYSLIDYSQTSQSPWVPPDYPFVNLQSGWYRTSTTYAPDDSWAWSINIGWYANMGYQYKTGDIRLWAVRGGEGCEDEDFDGICESEDNCPDVFNRDQSDSDGDGSGNACEECPDDPDKIEPGECGCNVAEIHSDGDGVPDCIDGCPLKTYKTDPGVCGCSYLDTDTDADGTPDCVDDFPHDPDEQDDTDHDGIGNNADMDDDNDGYSDELEAAGPNGGDGDFDGTPDSLQSNVFSLYVEDAEDYVTIVFDSFTQLVDFQIVESPPLDDELSDIEFPYGFFEFTIENVTWFTSISIIFPDDAVIETYYKFGPTPDNPTDHWYEFLFDGNTGAAIYERNIVLNFIDADRGDDVLDILDEKIIDLGGPGFQNSTAPEGPPSEGGGCFTNSLFMRQFY